MPKLSPPPAERARRKTLWDELNRLCLNNDAWVTSPNHAWPLTVETLNYDLPEALAEHGWLIQDAGSAERLLPVSEVIKQPGNVTSLTNQSLVPMTLKVFKIRLPS
jgi:hypothetical protein